MEITGLTQAEVEERISSGRVNGEERKTRNTFFDILFRNFTAPINLVLVVLGVALLLCHDIISAIATTAIMFINVMVSTIQEYRATRRLQKIALLVRPTAAVVRDGEEVVIDRANIVMDDVVHLRTGDQAQVDGEILSSRSVEMDESLLTGESRTVKKNVGDTISSGSSCVQGECYFKVTAVGEDTFSQKMTTVAKKYEKKTTPVQKETAAITKFLMSVALIFLLITVIKNMLLAWEINITIIDNTLRQAVIIIDIIPVALFLFISITYMISASRMADSGVLLQSSSSVESMSHVDTLCMDKTGTITTNRLVFEDTVFMVPEEEAVPLIRRMCASVPTMNRTLSAVCDKYGKEECELLDEVQFSSARKFSAVKVRKDSTVTVVTGAWSVLRPRCSDAEAVDAAVEEMSRKGLRTLVFCRAGDVPLHRDGEDIIPELEPVAVVSIRDEIRPDCRETIAKFHDAGVEIKVISGDDPDTVRALFDQADIPGGRVTVSGDELDSLSGQEFDRTVLNANIFGRMRPEQKETVIDSLRRNGRYVAMVGDGVNDVRPIKKANVGIAMQDGSSAARGVADMVLIGNNFKALPEAVYQGKRTVSGLRDILRFYLARNVILMALVLIFLVILGRSPLEPIQNTFWSLIAVSIPSLVIMFWAKATDDTGNIIPKIIRYGVPVVFTTVIFFAVIVVALFLCLENGIFDGTAFVRSMVDAMQGQFFDFLKNINGYDLTTYDGMVGFITNGNPSDLNYCLARNAGLLFLILSGIVQLILLFPPAKKLCWDREREREIVPLIMFGLMFLLMFVFYYFVPWGIISITSMVLFDLRIYVILIVLVVVWYVITLMLLKSKIQIWIGDKSEALANSIVSTHKKVRKKQRQKLAKEE